MINYFDLGSILHRFLDMEPRRKLQTTPPKLIQPPNREDLRISLLNKDYGDKKLRHLATFIWKPRDPSFSRFAPMHSLHRQIDRQTDRDTDNIMSTAYCRPCWTLRVAFGCTWPACQSCLLGSIVGHRVLSSVTDSLLLTRSPTAHNMK